MDLTRLKQKSNLSDLELQGLEVQFEHSIKNLRFENLDLT